MLSKQTVERCLYWLECDVPDCMAHSPATTWAAGACYLAERADWSAEFGFGGKHYCPRCKAQTQKAKP